jgi:hypothetical protein
MKCIYHQKVMTRFLVLLLLLLSYWPDDEAYASGIAGTWEGFAVTSTGAPIYVRLHVDGGGGYLLRSVPGSADVYTLSFRQADMTWDNGIIRITTGRPVKRHESYSENVIIFSLRSSYSMHSKHATAAIGSFFEYLVSDKGERKPFYTYAFELYEVKGNGILDAIEKAVEGYKNKSESGN